MLLEEHLDYNDPFVYNYFRHSSVVETKEFAKKWRYEYNKNTTNSWKLLDLQRPVVYSCQLQALVTVAWLLCDREWLKLVQEVITGDVWFGWRFNECNQTEYILCTKTLCININHVRRLTFRYLTFRGSDYHRYNKVTVLINLFKGLF
jgi:hypothetical protein